MSTKILIGKITCQFISSFGDLVVLYIYNSIIVIVKMVVSKLLKHIIGSKYMKVTISQILIT